MSFVPLPLGLTQGGYFSSGRVLKTFLAGTSTATPMYTDNTGATSTATVLYDANGLPTVSGSVVFPHINTAVGDVKYVLYPSQASADANTGALETWDNVSSTVASETALTTSIEYHLYSDFVADVITLSNTYSPGNGSLSVYRTGVLLRIGAGYDYTETSTTTVTLTAAAAAASASDDVFTFKVGAEQTTASLASSSVTYTPAGAGAVATNVQTKLRESISVKDFGAVGNDVTDDSVAVQNAIDYAGANHCDLYFPPGIYRFSGVTINTTYQGLTIYGAGKQRTSAGSGCTIFRNNNTTALFSFTGAGTSTGVTLKDFSFRQSAATDGGLLSSTNSLSEFVLKDFDWIMLRTNTHLVNITATSISNCKFLDHYGTLAAATTVSPYYIEATTGGSYFTNTFQDWFINSNDTTTAPVLRLQDTTGGSTNGCNKLDNLVFELCANGGAIHASGIRQSTFERIFCDDSGSNAAHLIHLDKSATGGSQESAYNTFIGCVSDEGTSTWKDLYVESAGPGSQTVVIGCRFDYIDVEGTGYTSVNNQVISDLSGQQPFKVFSGNITVPSNNSISVEGTGSISMPSGHTVPEIESGVTGVVTASGSATVTFATEFSSAPNVIVTHTAGTSRDGPVTVTGISTTGCTIHNWSTASSTVQWIAMN